VCVFWLLQGLGKTLTTLSLLWTLLKQGPGGRPAVGKALIVTPSSLTRNWAEEARKWLGNERLPTMVLEAGAGGAQQAAEFRHGAVARVCITSYETLRRHAGALSGCVGMVVADEGHRLKAAAGNKTMAAITGLGAARRVLLTGTPLQNNLSEFFAMCDVSTPPPCPPPTLRTLCPCLPHSHISSCCSLAPLFIFLSFALPPQVVNPGVLGTLPVFERVFGGPIARSRDRTASEEDKALGAQRSGELMRRVDTFVLRRGAEVNAAYLPPLSLFVVFCRPAPRQVALLRGVLGAGPARGVLAAAGPGAAAGDFGDQTLRVLTALRKICNHPALYDGTADAAGGEPAGTAAAGDFEVAHSGKLAALAAMLRRIVGADGMRCVVVSGSTAMLDLVAKFCATQGYSTARIDGSTDVSKRQDVVNAFNHHGVGQVFLLSTTAGGAGLNLTGSNRLVLVDSHWNPAMDAQALARVWRDGQRLPCVVYRLLTTGTLEEKVYQRQRAKGDIAAVTIGGGGGGGGGALGGAAAAATRGQFSREELRQLFTLRTDTACDTADVLGAAAAGGGGGGGEGEPFADCAATCGDGPLEAAIAEGHVTFVHLEKKQTNEVAVEVAAAEAAAAAAAGEPAGAGADDGAAGGSAAAGGGGGGGAWQLEVEDDL
jgi:DNA repair and recombination protein RAD54B